MYYLLSFIVWLYQNSTTVDCIKLSVYFVAELFYKPSPGSELPELYLVSFICGRSCCHHRVLGSRWEHPGTIQ